MLLSRCWRYPFSYFDRCVLGEARLPLPWKGGRVSPEAWTGAYPWAIQLNPARLQMNAIAPCRCCGASLRACGHGRHRVGHHEGPCTHVVWDGSTMTPVNTLAAATQLRGVSCVARQRGYGLPACLPFRVCAFCRDLATVRLWLVLCMGCLIGQATQVGSIRGRQDDVDE